MASVHHGVVYTKKWVVNLILDVAGYVPGTGISDKVIVEPSCRSLPVLVFQYSGFSVSR